jgi:hypothetical protein
VAEIASRRVVLVASLASVEPILRSGEVAEEVLTHDDDPGARSHFKMRDGVIEPLGSAPDALSSLALLCEAYRSGTGGGVEASTVFHAGAQPLADDLAALAGGVDFISGFSIAMQVYTGTGVVGIAWLPATMAS